LVKATDAGGLNDSTIVEIAVLNVNDNLPVIDAPPIIKIKPGFDIKKPIAQIKVTFFVQVFQSVFLLRFFLLKSPF